jgi:ketosteroid isomerase-like protein
MAVEDEVRQVSDRFYGALNRLINGDAGPMLELWSHGPEVTTMHPLGGRQVGWDQVRDSWEQAAKAISNGKVEARDVKISVYGDVSVTTLTEHAEASVGKETLRFEVRATNVYRRENGSWRVVLHHGDLIPQVQDIVRRLAGGRG